MALKRRWRERNRQRRRARLRILLWVAGPILGLVLLFGAIAAYRLVALSRDLERARQLIDRASSNIEAGQLRDARLGLDQALDLLTRSNKRLYNDPALDLLDPLPVVHQNLAALRSTVGLAMRMTDGGSRILAITQPLEGPDGRLEVPLDKGAVPLQSVKAAQAATQQLSTALPVRGTSPSTSLVFGSLAQAERRVFAEAGRRRTQLDAVSRGLDLLANLSGDTGPRRYLIAVANTAEMRGAGGMILSYGTLNASNGTFTLGDFGGIDELALDAPVDPVALSLPKDYLDRWSGLEPTLLWRNTTLNPDLAFDAPVMEAMYRQKTGLALDGVIQIDPAGLAAILEGTGPVTVDGVGTVDATNVVDLTLNRAYTDFPDRDQRQEVLKDVAKAAFDALVNGKYGSLRPLGTALYRAAQQRHLVLYANDSHVERLAASFGAVAAVPPAGTVDYALLTVQNFSKNKLDYYLDTSLQLAGERPEKRSGALTATVTVANTAPPSGQAPYVYGPNSPEQRRGLYRGVVSLYLPTGATLRGTSGDAPVVAPAVTSEAGRTVVSYSVELGPGATSTVTLELALPPRPAGDYQLTLVPVPRVRPTLVAVDIDSDGRRLVRPSGPLQQEEVLRTAK